MCPLQKSLQNSFDVTACVMVPEGAHNTHRPRKLKVSFFLHKRRLIVMITNAQGISCHPNRTLKANLIKINFVSSKSKVFKKNYFDYLSTNTFSVWRWSCVTTEIMLSFRKDTFWNNGMFLDCIQINIQEWIACLFYIIKKPQADSTIRQ